jgi:hypothetical protein
MDGPVNPPRPPFRLPDSAVFEGVASPPYRITRPYSYFPVLPLWGTPSFPPVRSETLAWNGALPHKPIRDRTTCLARQNTNEPRSAIK